MFGCLLLLIGLSLHTTVAWVFSFRYDSTIFLASRNDTFFLYLTCIISLSLWYTLKDIENVRWMVVLYSHVPYHNDTINKQTQEDFFRKICTSRFIVRVRKGYSRFACERELETKHNCNILTPTLMAVNVVSFSFSRCSTGGPAAQLSAGWWLSLLHLISNFLGPQLIRAPSAWCGFPYHISSITPSDL